MDYKVVLTKRAVDDLEEITSYFTPQDPDLAERFGNELIDRALTLAAFPQMGRTVREFNEPSLRELMHHPFESFIVSYP